MTTRRRANEGSWIAIPLANDKFGLCIAARVYRPAKSMMAFYFPHVYSHVPTELDTREWIADNAFAVFPTAMYAVNTGRWTVIHQMDIFDRKDWPLPVFQVPDPLSPGRGWLVEYCVVDPDNMHPTLRRRVPADQLKSHPRDGLRDFHSVENLFQRTFPKELGDHTDAEDPIPFEES